MRVDSRRGPITRHGSESIESPRPRVVIDGICAGAAATARRGRARRSGEHDVEPAGGAELPPAELGRSLLVEGEPREPLEQLRDGDRDEGAGEGVPGAVVPPGAEGDVYLAWPEDVEAVG